MKKRHKKDRITAIILAIFLGVIGIHRFYLNQTGLGILYIILSITGVSFLLSIIDVLLWAVQDEEEFDRKYNAFLYEDDTTSMNKHRRHRHRSRKRTQSRRHNTMDSSLKYLKKKGKSQFTSYDVDEAIDTFKKALSLNDNDISSHFNLACCYSINEEKERAYAHLSKAIELGFTDFNKIMNHEALAYMRIQDDWDEFKKNGFIIEQKSLGKGEGFNLLEKLRRLDQLKEKGHLSLEEFRSKKKDLLKQKEE